MDIALIVHLFMFLTILVDIEDFPSGLSVKNLPAVQEVWVQFLDWEDPLEKEMATCSRILARKIPWTE